MSQKVLLDIFETAFNKVVAHTACHFLTLHKKLSKQIAWKSNTNQTNSEV